MRQIPVVNPKIGDKVVRGKDWEWGDQDRNSEYGTVTKIKEDNWCSVEWVNKNHEVVNRQSYRIGAESKYDLYYYDTKSFEERHVVTDPKIGEKVVRNPENWISDYSDMDSEYGIIIYVSDDKKRVSVDWISKSGSVVRSYKDGPSLYTGYSGKYELLYYKNTSSNKHNNHARIIEVPAVKTTVLRGERSTGFTIRGRTGKTAIGVRYLGNQAVKGF